MAWLPAAMSQNRQKSPPVRSRAPAGRLAGAGARSWGGAADRPFGGTAASNSAVHWFLLGRGAKAQPTSALGDRRAARLEAVLFLSREALSSRKLAQLASLADGTEARTLVRHLNRSYDAAGRAFRVEEVAGGFRLLTRAKFGPWLRRLHQATVEGRISGPALETLAVVAYRQPVQRTEVESIRGVQCGEMLRQLMERDLVRIAGRTEDLGRPFVYGTTRRFLQLFGLRDLDALPRAAALRDRGPAPESKVVPLEASSAPDPYDSPLIDPQETV
jgi:segregation and condensation protein B